MVTAAVKRGWSKAETGRRNLSSREEAVLDERVEVAWK
jgi:hypothetical protein